MSKSNCSKCGRNAFGLRTEIIFFQHVQVHPGERTPHDHTNVHERFSWLHRSKVNRSPSKHEFFHIFTPYQRKDFSISCSKSCVVKQIMFLKCWCEGRESEKKKNHWEWFCSNYHFTGKPLRKIVAVQREISMNRRQKEAHSRTSWSMTIAIATCMRGVAMQ